MPIRPIDTLSMPIRSQESSQVQHGANQRQAHVNEQLATAQNANIKHESKQAVKADKSENKEYRYQDGKNGKNGYAGKRKKKENEEEKDEKKGETNEFKPGGFDIRI